MYKKSIIAVAVAMASCGAYAGNWENVPESVDSTIEITDSNVDDNGVFNKDLDGTHVAIANVNDSGRQNNVVYVVNRTINEGAKLWVVAGENQRIFGIKGQGADGVATNNGTIFVDGTKSANWKVKGMGSAGGGKIVNNGAIYVKNATAMTTSKQGGSLVNNGDIIVESGFGMRLENQNEGVSLTNKGTIVASEEAFAIDTSESADATVILSDKSNVDGLVLLTEKTTLKFEDNKDSISLYSTVGNVEVNNSEATIEQGTDAALKVGTLNIDKSSNAQFKLRRIANEGETILSVDTVEGEGKDAVGVGYTGNVSDELLQGADAKLLTSGVSLGGETVESVTVDQGLSGDALVVDKDGNVKTVQANSLITSAQDVAVASALMWRDQLSSLSDRMGTLRTMPGEVGSWARYTNGRLDGNDIEHDFNTIEVGFDKKINDSVALGASFAYTKGDTDVIAGTADNNTYTGGLYATYMNESNCFFDAMLKIGRIDAEYDLMTSAGAESADYMMTGTIFGIEAGHRWNVQNFYVEPALQVTYSHIRPASYTSSIERQVKYEAMESLIAKVGVTGGMTFAEKGAAFAAVSYNHDFMGDVEGRYTHDSITRTFEDELDDNWGEAKLGASYQVTNGLNAFADVATTFGGDIDQKWRVNIGARYVF